MPVKPDTVCTTCLRAKKACECKKKTADRGYGWLWQQERKRYLDENPLCTDCLKESRTTLAQHVHHSFKAVDYPEYFWIRQLWMPLCEACHNIRSARGE